jgi:hypothetical protein
MLAALTSNPRWTEQYIASYSPMQLLLCKIKTRMFEELLCKY